MFLHNCRYNNIGNREKILEQVYFTRITRAFSYVTKPMGNNYLTKEKFELPLLKDHVSELSNVATSKLFR